jgi:amino acid transporter
MGTLRVIYVSDVHVFLALHETLLTCLSTVSRSACISTCGWWLGLASVCNFVAAMVLAIVQLCIEDYTIRPWHQWLCYVAILWLAVALNIFGTRFLPAFNRFIREWKGS